MSPLVLVTAVLVAVAVVLAAPARRVGGLSSAADPSAREPGALPDHGMMRRFRPVLTTLALAGVWSILGGMLGLGAGVVAAVGAWRVLGEAEGPRARSRRRELEETLPIAVHLLGACLETGAALVNALDAVAAAVRGPAGEELRAIRTRLVLGGDPVTVWREVGRAGALAPLGRRLARAHESGASVAAAVERLSADLRGGVRARAEAKARSVEVRAAAPLGVCLLPSFLLLGVVPMTAGILGSLDVLG